MKLLYLTHQYFPRHVGGTEVYTRGLVRHVIRSGHQARVIAYHENPSPDRQDSHIERTSYEGVPLVEVHYNLSVAEHPARAEYDNAFAAQAVRDELDCFRPDVVHVLHAMKLSGAAVQACVDAGVPVIVTLCDFWFLCPRHTLLQSNGQVCTGPDTPFKCVACVRDLHGFAALPETGGSTSRVAVNHAATAAGSVGVGLLADLTAINQRADFLRRVLLQTRRIIALSDFQKKMFVANGYPAERLEVIAHGLDLEVTSGSRLDAHLQVEGWHGQRRLLRRLGFVGSLVPHKGAHVLLEALAQVPDWPVECRIHGPLLADGYGQRLQEMAARDARVQLLGGFAPEDLGRLLGELDLLAAPALWYENDPLVVKAALKLGLPVLASRIGTLEDMLAGRGAEWLVEPGNPEAWAAALRRLQGAPVPAFRPISIKGLKDNAREMLAIYQAVKAVTGAAA